MVKKYSDGNYYEKIVNWKKNKEQDISLILGVGLLVLVVGIYLGRELTNVHATTILFTALAVMGFIGHFFHTHDRKVKFRRIK